MAALQTAAKMLSVQTPCWFLPICPSWMRSRSLAMSGISPSQSSRTMLPFLTMSRTLLICRRRQVKTRVTLHPTSAVAAAVATAAQAARAALMRLAVAAVAAAAQAAWMRLAVVAAAVAVVAA
jgi:hypothetical protein